MATWAHAQDVADRWVGSGAPTESDATLVENLLQDAEAVILSQFPLIQDRIDAETLPLATVVMVECRMVSRVLRNPEGLTYIQQTTGPFGQAKNYGSTGGDIWMTPDEIALLAPQLKGKAFEFDLAPNAIPGIPVPPYNGSETSFGDFRLISTENRDDNY